MGAGRTCAASSCDKPARAKGYCSRHYKQLQRHGRLTPEKEHRDKCLVSGCDRPHKARGYCAAHYKQLTVHGKIIRRRQNKDRKCYLIDCNNPARAKGLCNTHHRYYLTKHVQQGQNWEQVDKIIVEHNQNVLSLRNRLAIIVERHAIIKARRREEARRDALYDNSSVDTFLGNASVETLEGFGTASLVEELEALADIYCPDEIEEPEPDFFF